MDVTWVNVNLPALGRLGEHLIADQMPEPWRSHAHSGCKQDRLSAAKTSVLIAWEHGGGIVASGWLSMPDIIALAGYRAFSFLSHVEVDSRFRRLGLGARLVRLACDTSSGFDLEGVLLATSDESLKSGFYAKLGFRSVGSDPWLMEYVVDKAGRAAHKSHSTLTHSRLSLRAVSPYDLATVQSICAQEHWLCSASGTQISVAEECEETFCSFFVDEDSSVRRQFIAHGISGESRFVSWVFRENNNWFQRLLCSIRSDSEVAALSSAVIDVILKVQPNWNKGS
jgi:predicted N-acetyltransferase YhbS